MEDALHSSVLLGRGQRGAGDFYLGVGFVEVVSGRLNIYAEFFVGILSVVLGLLLLSLGFADAVLAAPPRTDGHGDGCKDQAVEIAVAVHSLVEAAASQRQGPMALGQGRFQVRLFRFFVRLSRSQVGHSQRPAGAGRVTCGRGSRDLRARVV